MKTQMGERGKVSCIQRAEGATEQPFQLRSVDARQEEIFRQLNAIDINVTALLQIQIHKMGKLDAFDRIILQFPSWPLAIGQMREGRMESLQKKLRVVLKKWIIVHAPQFRDPLLVLHRTISFKRPFFQESRAGYKR